jgi:hypothetical protein
MRNSSGERWCQCRLKIPQFPPGASSVLCKRPLFFLAPQAVGAVGKWESRFWISTFPQPTFKSWFWSFSSSFSNNRFFRLGWDHPGAPLPGPGDLWLAALVGPFSRPAMPARLAGRGRLAESRSAARPPSSSAPASSTSWQYAPAPGTVASSPHPHWETTPAS